MKHEIEGHVVGINKETKFNRANYTFKIEIEDKYTMFWKIGVKAYSYMKLTEFKMNETVTIVWDDKAYTAMLKLSEVQFINLVRDFSKSRNPEDHKFEKLVVIKCPSCGSNVPLEYKDEAVCMHCMTKIELNIKQAEAVKKSKEILNTNQKLFDELNAIFLNRLNPKLFKAFCLIPLILLASQIVMLAYGSFFGGKSDFISDEIFNDFLMEDYNFGLMVVLPSVLIAIVMIWFTRKNAYSIDISYLYAIFSPSVSDNNEYACRSCGSPLNIYEIPQMTVCSYCQTENIAVGNSKSMNKISEMMNINYLFDIKIMHNEFKRKYNDFFLGVMVGLIFFYGIFFAYTMQWEHIEDVSFLVQFIAMPFIVLILLYFLSQIAVLPYLQFNDWLPKYFSEYIKKKEIQIEEHRPFILKAMPVIQFGLFLLFFISLFFMR